MKPRNGVYVPEKRVRHDQGKAIRFECKHVSATYQTRRVRIRDCDDAEYRLILS